MLQSLSKAFDKVKENIQELREEAVGSSGPTPPTTAAPAPVFGTAQGTGSLFSFHLCGHDIEGISVGGQETCIILPRVKVALDIGRCPQRAVFQQTVLISHGHLDHIGGVPFHASSRMLLSLPPARYIVPPEYEDGLRRYLEAASAVEGNSSVEYEVLTLAPGQEQTLPSGYIVRSFPTVHTIPSQGYILYSYRRKLKPELIGRSQEEIRELRLAGEEVTDTYQIPEVAFTADTTAELFERDDADSADMYRDLYRAKLLIVELTFVDDSARERGHMHIADFVAHSHKFHNEKILLIHFSPRYKQQEILQALDLYLPPSLRAKCVPLLAGFAK